jgi:hypothetical protein
MTPGDCILEGFEGLILKFNNVSAIQTDQVIVMASFQGGFIPGLSVGKFSLGRQAETGEELQGAIDRHVADFRIDFGDLRIDLGKVFVSGGTEKDFEDLFPLLC